MNLISTTNQQKVSQVPIKQQIPLKLASRLSTGALNNNNTSNSNSGCINNQQQIQQMLPLKLSQEEKVRRTSTGYQRLGSDSLSPTSGETVSKN